MNRLVLLSCLLAIPVGLSAQGNGVAAAASSITAQDVRARIGVLADDSMRGRNTPSPELEEVARYVASQFKAFGLAPGGDDGGFLQRYAVQRVQLDTAASGIRVAGGVRLSFSDQLALLGGSAPQPVRGPTLLVTGAVTDSGAVDAQQIAGAVVLYDGPRDPDSGRLTDAAQATINALYGAGPAAIVLVVDTPDDLWARQMERQARVRVRLGAANDERLPLIGIRPPGARRLLGTATPEATAGPLRVQRLPNAQMEVAVATTVLADLSAPNTVGILEGSDPTLKQQYVVFSGHMDHVGVGRAVDGDSIYNGADDDASGTTGVIELAEAFSTLHPRPKRSMIFLTVSGEEKGLWGSSYFTSHPPVPIDQIVADLNMDMIGRNWQDTIVVIGKEHSDLGATLNRVNARHPELNMTAIDDIWPEERFYYRSDHFNFARRGVPILFFFNGTHPDYHRPSDEVAKIEPEKESRIIKLVFYLGLEVANATERPQWNPESYKQIVEGGGN